MTVHDLITAYRVADTPTRQEDERHATWWSDRIGRFLVEELSPELIQRQLLASAKCGRSVWTSNFYFRFLRRVCRWGQLMAYLPADPCRTIPLPKDKPPTLRVLTEEEEAALCRELGQPYALWVKFAILTGLKQSEQFTLLWRSVDLATATLHVPGRQSGTVVALSVPPDAVAILHQLHRLHPPSLWVFPDLRNPHRPANVHAFYVGRWESAVRRAGIPKVAWKDLRHTCGVRLARHGVPVREITTFLRQREVRQAYYYRAHQPGEGSIKRAAIPKAVPVFDELPVEQLHELIGRDVTTSPLTFQELCHLYAAHHLKARPSRRDFESLYRQHWQAWGDRLPATITRKEIKLWYLTLAQTPAQANRGVGYLRAIFNWGADMELLTCANPAVRLKRYPQPPRERFMDVEEVQRFMDGLSQLPLKPQAFLLVLVLTGCRMGEALVMRWADLEPETRRWRKPRTKNGTSHTVPLPLQAMEALSCLPRQSEWVFPGKDGKHWSKASIDKIWQRVRRQWNLSDVRLHDIRRTVASYLAISGENLPTIQSVLNHHSLAPTSIYARLNVKAVDRALQAQADRLCSLGQPDHAVLPGQPALIAHHSEN